MLQSALINERSVRDTNVKSLQDLQNEIMRLLIKLNKHQTKRVKKALKNGES